MDDRKFEQMLERLLKRDYSKGTEEFRDGLLVRCLEELDSSEREVGTEDDQDYQMTPIADDDLALLSAAGNIHINRHDTL